MSQATIQLNGEAHDLPENPTTVAGLLAALALDPRLVAVERNRTVVRRAAYATTEVRAGDEVEIVAFVGGG